MRVKNLLLIASLVTAMIPLQEALQEELKNQQAVVETAPVIQDAKTVLDKLSAKTKGYSAMYAEYELKLVDDKAGGTIATQTGKAWIKGEKLKILMEDYHIYNDSKTFWTYDVESNECYIDDTAEMMEEKDISPSDLFTIWETGFKQEHKGKVTEMGMSLTQINLYPTDSESTFHTIVLLIDEAKMEIKRATIKGRDGQVMIYTIKKFQANPSVSDADFQFEEASHPNVDVIDNRF